MAINIYIYIYGSASLIMPGTVKDSPGGYLGAVPAPNYFICSEQPGIDPAQTVRKTAWRQMGFVFQGAQIRFGNFMQLPPYV